MQEMNEQRSIRKMDGTALSNETWGANVSSGVLILDMAPPENFAQRSTNDA
jgi:hypothetical protein